MTLSTNNGRLRIQVVFNAAAGHFIKHYVLDEDTLRKAELWEVAQKTPLSAQQFADWLEQNGGQLDRVDGPAVTTTLEDGTRIEEWFRNNQRDRADGPAFIRTHKKDSTRIEEWWSNGQLNRADGPAIIVTFDDGTRHEAWWTKGRFIKEEKTPPPLSIPGVTLDPPPAPPQP